MQQSCGAFWLSVAKMGFSRTSASAPFPPCAALHSLPMLMLLFSLGMLQGTVRTFPVFVLSCYVSKFRGSRMPLHPEHGGEKNSKKSGTKRSFSLKASHPHFSLEFQHQTFSGLCVFCVLWVEFNIKFSGSRKHWELYWGWNGLCEVYEIEVIHCYLFDV